MHDTTCTNSQFFLHTVIQYNSSLFLSTRLYCVTFLLLLFCVVDLHFISERTTLLVYWLVSPIECGFFLQ
jgi:hypothetical protein